MKNPVYCCLFFYFFPLWLTAQQAFMDSIWLETPNLRVCLRTNGSLYAGSKAGAVQFRHQSLFGEKWTTVVKESGLWFGGIDPAGNLLLSAQQFEPNRITDFRAGLPGLPGSDKFWLISHDQIVQHLEDYSQDAVIDHPIPEIFAWPGPGNRFFKAYNGFELPIDFHGNWGNFLDRNNNNIYEPDKGEYPVFKQTFGGKAVYFPDQIVAFLFHTDGLSLEFPATSGYPASGMGYAYTLNCPAKALFANSIYFTWVWQNAGARPLDSNYVACYINADIGNPNDDYHGSNWNTYWVYNADSVYDARFEMAAPVLSVRSIQGPLDMYGGANMPLIMPVGTQTDLPPVRFPESPLEYYRYLTCHWRDGTPLTNGGNGYGGSEVARQVFRGNPYAPGVWSEVNAQTTRGDRRALFSWYYHRWFLPGATNSLSYYLTVHPKPETTQANYEWFESIINDLSTSDWVDGFGFSGSFEPGCNTWPVSTFDHMAIRTYPNPVSDMLYIQYEGDLPTRIRLYDWNHRVAAEIIDMNLGWGNPVQIPVRHLPPGVYFLEAGSRNSIQTNVQKVVVLH
ncbi:MAG: T9SS type A sorting domain-containing protein [Lewinellaceae bacterium]|nr:T9SS type A sorting domain-containing protein [Lewinellaceae bacterium]